MTKVSQISMEEFVTSVTNTNSALVASIKDATKVINDTYKENQQYSVQTAIAFAIKRLKKAKTDESATDVKGIIFGKRVPSEKAKWSYALLQGKKGIEVGTWRGEVETGDKKIKLPVDSAVAIKIKMDEYNERKSWEVVNVMGRNPYTREMIYAKLQEWGAILSLDDVVKMIKNTNPAPVVCVKVTIAGANASKKFGTDQYQDIWQKFETDGKMWFEGPNISLRTRKTENDNMAWVRVIGTAPEYITVEDFEEISKDVITRFDNPADQAAFLSSALEDRTFIVIAAIQKIQGDNENGYTVNMNALALLEDIMDTTPVLMGQQPLPQAAEVEEEKPVEEAPLMPVEAVASTEKKMTTAPKPEPVAEPVAEQVAEPVVEEVNIETINIEPVTETISSPTPAPTQEAQVLEKTPKEIEIENKLLFCTAVKVGGLKDAARSEKVAAMQKVSLADLVNMGAIKRLMVADAAIVEQIYEEFVNGTRI